MKKLKLFISLWFTMFSIVMFGQAEYEKIAITQNTQDNTAGRLLVQDVTTGEVRWILKSILDNKFNQPTGDATQYLDGAGNPTTFPVLSQSDRVITEVRNSTGATITKGTVVYLNGATGGKPNVQKAQANAEATSSGTFGVIQSDINNNSNGYVVVIGTVLGLNTSAYTAGQVLWLSPTTAGGFTTTKPVAPNHAVYVGIVTLAATQGTIEVKIQNGYELDEIHDVLINSKTDNDALIYESSSGLWKNKQITKAMIGLANVDNTSDLNKPISTATQTALNLKENTANKNTANGYAGLGSDGKLISSQLPAITITDTFVVGSQSAMLALTAETGDVAVRTDVNKSFILKGTSAGTLADWQELLTPTSSVTSVFGRQGAVTANNGDYTTEQVTETTNKRYQTDIQQTYNDATSSIQTQLNAKEPSISAPGTTGSYWRGNKTFATLDTSVIPENGSLFFTNDRAKIAVTGNSGSINYVSKFTSNGTIGNSLIYDNGTNVGIGTSSPNSLLNIASTFPQFTLTRTDNGTNAAAAINFASQSTVRWQITTNNAAGTGFEINQADGSANRFYINPSGNVGIGTTSPAQKLVVNGRIRVTTNDSDGGDMAVDDGGLSFSTNNSIAPITFKRNNYSSESMRITSGGNVGIGTTTPMTKLTINNGMARTNTTQTYSSYIHTNDSDDFRFGLATIIKGGATGADRYTAFESSSYQVSTNTFSAGLSLSLNPSGGNVGIGTSSPTEKLEVSGNAKATSFIKSGGTSSQFLMADGSVKTSESPYKVYTALIGQTGTNAPTVTVLDNSIGLIVWSYVSPGVYLGTLSGAFTAAKTTCEISTISNMYNINFSLQRNNNSNQVFLQTLSSGTGTNGLLGALGDNSAKIEIRVYN